MIVSMGSSGGFNGNMMKMKCVGGVEHKSMMFALGIFSYLTNQ